MESELSDLKQRTLSSKDRFDRHYEALRLAKFTDPDGNQVKALLALLEEDEAEMQSITREVDRLKDIVEEVKRDNNNLAGVILSTATAVLGLTATFSSNLIPEHPNAIGLLIFSWISLAGTIIAFPIGSLINMSARMGLFRSRINGYKLSGVMSGVGFGLFVSGIIGFLFFAILNLPI